MEWYGIFIMWYWELFGMWYMLWCIQYGVLLIRFWFYVFGMVCLMGYLYWRWYYVFVRGLWCCLFDISTGCLALSVCHGVYIVMCLVWSIGYDMSSMEYFVWDIWHREFGMVVLLWGTWLFTDMYRLSIYEATWLILNKVSVV